MRTRIIRKMIGASLLAVTLLTVSFAMHEVAYAKETSVNISGKQYELAEKSKYDYDDGTTPTIISSSGSQFGLFGMSGNLKVLSETNGFSSYEVSSGLVTFSYSPNGTVIGASDTDWHLIEDSASEVNGEKIDQKIRNGVVILQTSIDGTNWITDLVKGNIAGSETDYSENFYETAEIQLINGCYYRVIVAYEVERRLDDKQYLFVKVGNSEKKKFVEVYEFYLKDTSEATIAAGAHPNTKKVVGDMTKVVNTGKDNGYSQENAITSKDPHYGWKLGEFSLKGYTNTADYQGEEYFLKNLGDAITLSFTLNQNINSLNGMDNLAISEDTNGSDQYFQVQKTNFKHGTLIIRFTDFQGNKSDPIIYTDFLAANARSGADTRVQFFEEGDYEVALDYEIKNTSGIDSYTNYRMFFTFKIRNGNNMVYAFDPSGQLTDKAWTSSGFTVNTANSHYLTVTVNKYAIADGVGGKKLDLSWSRTANDGNSYKDPGVYEVTVSNRYQPNGDVTKTFYVGDDPYIKAIPITGMSLDDIVKLIKNTDVNMQTYLDVMSKERKSLEEVVDLVKNGWTIGEAGQLIEPPVQEVTPISEPGDEPENEEPADIPSEVSLEKEEGNKTDEKPVNTSDNNEEKADETGAEDQIESSSAVGDEAATKGKSTPAIIIVVLAVIASAGGVWFARKRGRKIETEINYEKNNDERGGEK